MKLIRIIFLFLCPLSLLLATSDKQARKVEEISPIEDLMREHGLLSRLLLIYEAVDSRISQEQTIPLTSLQQAATLIHSFIEGYHEVLEENYIFPKFEQAKYMTDLVSVLRSQHTSGKAITNNILSYCEKNVQDKENLLQLQQLLRSFISMYRPHKAREDTVLFVAFKDLVPEKEYQRLGELFEQKEKELFGEKGFETTVQKVALIEQKLGIYTLK